MSSTDTTVTITAGDTTIETTADALEQAADALASDPPLFNPNAYEDPRLRLTTKDGRRVNEISLAFNGAIDLHRLRHGDVSFFRSLKLGDEIELTVTCIVAGDADIEKPATAQRGKVIHARKTLRVHSLDIVPDDEDDDQ